MSTPGINSTWEQITGWSGSVVQDSVNFIDNAFLGTLSDYQKNLIDQTNEAGITQAAGGNSALASSEISQYQKDVNAAVYSGLPATAEQLWTSLVKYAPWIAGGIALLYLLPFLRSVSK